MFSLMSSVYNKREKHHRTLVLKPFLIPLISHQLVVRFIYLD
jgi:hypothetical protein